MRTQNTHAAVIAAMVAITGIAAGPVRGQDLPAEQAHPNALAPAPTSPGKTTLGVDDKLKISFFETIDVGTKPAERQGVEPQAALRTFFQRMDLSGEYAIDQDGAIAIPLLGRFAVGGRGLDDLRSELIAAFSAVTGRAADVSATIIERPPIYVVGPVKNPGAYKYVPGMFVLHAIALAGGYDRGESSLSNVIEGVREMERLQKTSDQIQRLQARRARLEAQRDGLTTVPIPVQLSNRNTNASAFLSIENAVLQAAVTRRQERESVLAAKAVAASREVEALKRRLNQADIQRDMRVERLDDMQKLKDRGVVTNNSVIALRTELADIEARREEYVVAVIQAESRLAQAEEAKARFTSDEEEALAKDISAVDQEIADASGVISSSEALTTILLNGRSQQPLTYQILRQSKDGAAPLPATETTALKPGDVLKVGVGTSDIARSRARATSIIQRGRDRPVFTKREQQRLSSVRGTVAAFR